MARTARRFANLLHAWPRALIAVAALLLLFLVLKVSVVGILRGPYPSAALAWSPRDAQARANLASLILTRDRSPGALNQATALAEDAIRRDPMQVGAVRTLAMVSAERGHEAEALRRMALAQRLSRRDYLTQSWIIRYYSRTAQPEALVRHFDIALRTSARNRQTLMPLLVGATIDPAIVPPLRATLLQAPPWRRDFMAWLVERAPSGRSAALLSRGMLDPAIPEQRTFIQTLINTLVTRRDYETAAQIHAQAARTPRGAPLVQDGGFEAVPGFWPFDWSLTQEADLWAARERRTDRRNGNVLRLVAFNGRTGDPARQLIRLPAGTYRLRAVAGDVPVDAFDRPTLRVTCAGERDTTTYISLRPARSGVAPTQIAGRFSVPSTCSWQWLSIHVAGDGAQPETSPWVDDVAIDRAP